ncbi:protein farnesyltransferase/ geranylgeranyltransferase type-1 subunit alpha [Phtheirospermum japonicum]|uniref:Protein farnesyltransferase/geranylgeranyltransferase type-1 subunit alpha n=1 Tax=Phtheirospermum japonicum TaxID=374723 RepID=A0A830CWX8_9LAMI|nr:protein farnesyltransferase/ geranylgeranyltransferase type-1 subunit alpha [Phtheirospermum japonicum]
MEKIKELHRMVENGTKTKDPETWRVIKSIVKNLEPNKEALLDELKFTAGLLREDANNKYAWSHRQWVLDKLGKGCADEIGFCKEILKDERNIHSRLAWDQRCFAVQKCLERGWTFARPSEAIFAITAILKHPENENPWRYLRLLYNNDLKALAPNHHLQFALACVFTEARDSVKGVTVDVNLHENQKHARLFDSVNKRGCLFALDLISDLLKHGFQLDKEAEDAIEEEELKPVALLHRRIPPAFQVSSKNWRVSALTMMMMDVFTLPVVYFLPEDTSWFPSFSEDTGWERENAEQENLGSSQLTRDDTNYGWAQNYVDKYPDMPESLRDYCWNTAEYTDKKLVMLTHDLLFYAGHNNPTVWQFRHLVIEKCSLNLQDEVKVLELLSKGSISNDNLFWHHRRWVSEKIGSDAAAKKELEFTDNILSEDPYNYRAWSHRQWVCQVFGIECWGKLNLRDKFLKKDASNCFAWNQRYFVSVMMGADTREREAKYATDVINAEAENEMPWTYLKCLVDGKMNHKILLDSDTAIYVLINEVKHMRDGEADDAIVKKRVVNALKMLLFTSKSTNFKPRCDLKRSINHLRPSKGETFVEKVTSILHSMDVSWIGVVAE